MSTKTRNQRRPSSRKRRRENTTSLSSLLLLSSITLRYSRAQGQCDYISDTCHYQFDGECDADIYCGSNTDCFDCDECAGFNFDCSSCVAAGCYWCPGDAVCSSQPIGADVWALHSKRQPACGQTLDWVQQCNTNPDNTWTDPLYDSMKWLYQLINVEEVWAQGITGQGIHVRVNDDGVDADHPEFASNFLPEYSCTKYYPDDYENDKHGTACASLIAGGKNNNECAVGIAPDVDLSACNGPDTLAGATELFRTHLEVVDVISNSWGPLPCEEKEQVERKLQQQRCPFDLNHPETPCDVCGLNTFSEALTADCEQAIINYCKSLYENDPVACGEYLDLYVTCDYHSISNTNEEGFAQIIAEGRGGKGPIITFAGGNDYKIGVDANGDGLVNSRYTIAVAAVGKDGLHASYSTTGAAILVSAPGGDDEALSNNVVAMPGGGCHDITVGTSFATPVVSAVAALILQANPELGWRDLQGILAVTSQRVDFEDSSWYTNAAGISHSYKYGFGLIDALAAVEAAKMWKNWDSEKQIMGDSGTIDIAIPDNSEAPVLGTITITEEDVLTATGTSSISMESVVVYLDLAHGSRGDLEIVLISPQGTRSVLAPGKRPENTVLEGDERWKLMTVRNWGESPIGTWALEIADEEAGLVSDCVNRDWEASTFGQYWDCNDIATLGVTDCSSPAQVPFSLQVEEFNGLTMFDACCACGGGFDALSIQQMLKSWKVIAYGHTADDTPPPTPEPVTATNPPTPAASAPGSSVIPAATLAPLPFPAATLAPAPLPASTSAPQQAVCTYRNDTQLTGDSGPLNAAIPDAGFGYIFSTMTVTDPTDSTVDSVELNVVLTHQSPGDLRVTINTGAGTEILLAPGGRVATTDPPGDLRWTFTSCEASGESPNGNWTLSVEDTSPGIQAACSDLAWEATVNTTTYQCSSFGAASDCTNQPAAATVFEDRTAVDSCCVCGGGESVDVAGIASTLVSWDFVLYSRSQNYVVPAPLPGSGGTFIPGAPGVSLPPAETLPPVPAPTLPSPFTAALMMTIPPNTTGKPFVTNGDYDQKDFFGIPGSNTTSSSPRHGQVSLLLLGACLGFTLF